jgi:hypothetical protein
MILMVTPFSLANYIVEMSECRAINQDSSIFSSRNALMSETFDEGVKGNLQITRLRNMPKGKRIGKLCGIFMNIHKD